VLPLDPVRQYTGEPVAGPLTLQVYPGADGRFMIYEDDGASFAFRRGDWTGMDLSWQDQDRRLSIRLASGSRMRPPGERPLEIQIVPEKTTRPARFTGEELVLRG
jgi:alpha-D-xyloside xylohydrolase